MNDNESLSRIHPQAILEDGCTIGENVTIEEFVVIRSGTVIENGAIVRTGAKIGTAPFAFEKVDGVRARKQGAYGVVIREGADIGSNVVIQRGLERNTVIGPKTHVNNSCSIGHDVHIGSDCTVGLANSISGHAELGDNVYLAPGVTVMNRVTLGSRVKVGIGSLVLHDAPDDSVILGRPAVDQEEFRRERKTLLDLVGTRTRFRVLPAKRVRRRFLGRLKDRIKRLLF